jgi:hypothetical protein
MAFFHELDAAPRAALVVVDNLGAAASVVARVRQKAAELVKGLAPESILVAATHTHSAPLLKSWTKAGKVFDTLAVRDALRERCAPKANVTYREVFPEVWHRFHEGRFLQPYLVRTKVVDLPDHKADTTVEYVPEEGVVFKRVADKWHAA